MKRVLLVDDSALIRSSMEAALEPYGFDIGHAENGQIAVAMTASAAGWDLIFLDCVMPIMDGPTALREIRATGNMTPVVLVTSVSTASVVASAVKLGKVHYIAKPFTRDQIRAVAIKLLKLDPAVLAKPPRVLLQHVDPALPAQLRKLLPSHVLIDTTQALAQSLELAEARPLDLVLIESSALADEMAAIANVLRRISPTAGIFAINSDPLATPKAGSALWQPDEGLDGFLPRTLDEPARNFLVNNFLRPLVIVEGGVARVSAFRGAPVHLPAYAAMLVRLLVDRCAKVDATADLQIDLTRLPTDADIVVNVANAANTELRQAGAAPAFRLSPAVVAQAAQRLAHCVIVQ